MSHFVCKECGNEFDKQRSFHAHLKAHSLTIGDYYVKHYDRRYLYTGEKLAFRSYYQYFRDNFNCYDNFKLWMDSAPEEEVKTYIKERVVNKFTSKEISISPPNLFYDLWQMASIFYYTQVWGSYSASLEEVGVENYFNANLPKDFWENDYQTIPIFTDTREKTPLIFKDSVTNKLDFGDYTARGDLYTKTFVDRKSQDDFRQTFGKDIDRFRREMDRCVEFNSYMFVVVETKINKLEEDNKVTKLKYKLGDLWKQIRNLIIDNPKNKKIISGDTEKIKKIYATWIFSRDTTSANPNLQLVSTLT